MTSVYDKPSSSSPIGMPPIVRLPTVGNGSDGEGCAAFIALILVFGIPIGALLFLYSKLGPEIFYFSAKMFVLAVCITLIPTISATIVNNLLARALLDVLMLSLGIVGAFWMFGIPISVLWISYGVGLTAVLELGGLLNKFNMNYTVASIQQTRDKTLFDKSMKNIKQVVRYGEVVYISIPLSILIGTIIGMVRLSPPQETLKLTIIITLSVVGIELLLIAALEFVRMCHPLVHMLRSPDTELETKLDRAYAIAEVRKIYLWDSTHSIIILVGLALVGSRLAGLSGSTSVVMIVSLFVILSFSFNQIPYVIGQALMRRTLLSGIHGLRKAQALETLDKYVPLFPMSRYVTALSMSSTAGYFAYKLLEKVVVDILGKSFGAVW